MVPSRRASSSAVIRSPSCSPMRTAGSPTAAAASAPDVERDVVHADRADERQAPPADQHVGVVREPAAARRRRSRSARSRACVGSLGDEAPPVAGALPRRDRLHAPRPRTTAAAPARRSRGARVLAERVQPVERDAGADEVEVRARGRAASRRCWRRAATMPGCAARSGRPRRGSVRAARRRSRRPARRRWRSGSSRRRARTPGAAAPPPRPRAACAGSRVPSRPIPVSSLTCTRPPPRRRRPPTSSSRQATTSAPAASATSSSPGDSAPRTRIGTSAMPASRSSAASCAAATASHVAPPASAARAAGTAPWP